MIARRSSGVQKLALPLAVAIPLVLAGCDAGPGNETAKDSATHNVANGNAGAMAVRGARLVVSSALTTSSPTPSPSSSPAVSPTATVPSLPPSPSPSSSVLKKKLGKKAGKKKALASPSPTGVPVQGYLTLVIVNRGSQPDTLTSVTAAGNAVQPSGSGSISIKPRQSVQFGDPEIGLPGPTLEVIGLPTPPVPGSSVRVTVSFQNNGTANLTVPVKDAAAVGSTATAEPVHLTGHYPTESPTPAEGRPTPTAELTNEPNG
ncbi:MAG TPA: hypothetical protein VFT62_09795 [Mycobacteriales bacterium]|nr:hypothetical protein [Mycobacteriales bacterium]